MSSTQHNPNNPNCQFGFGYGYGAICTCVPLFSEAKPRNGSQTFYSLLTKAGDIHDSKSHDYADNSDPLGNYRFAGELAKLFSDPTDAGLIGRFGEKLYRLANLEKSEKTAKNEPVSDTEIDLLVIIGLFVAARQDRRNKITDYTCTNCHISCKGEPVKLVICTNERIDTHYFCSVLCKRIYEENAAKSGKPIRPPG